MRREEKLFILIRAIHYNLDHREVLSTAIRDGPLSRQHAHQTMGHPLPTTLFLALVFWKAVHHMSFSVHSALHFHINMKIRHDVFMIENDERNDLMDDLCHIPVRYGQVLTCIGLIKISMKKLARRDIEIPTFPSGSSLRFLVWSFCILKNLRKRWAVLDCNGIYHLEKKGDILLLRNLVI